VAAPRLATAVPTEHTDTRPHAAYTSILLASRLLDTCWRATDDGTRDRERVGPAVGTRVTRATLADRVTAPVTSGLLSKRENMLGQMNKDEAGASGQCVYVSQSIDGTCKHAH
jgi:hypothetical protein